MIKSTLVYQTPLIQDNLFTAYYQNIINHQEKNNLIIKKISLTYSENKQFIKFTKQQNKVQIRFINK